ncbi:MAG: DNA repair protein RadC [Saprospiraceae bacterium]|nr:DNA repair protein RadC [Saprospiraceae bacterium]
MKPNLNIKSWSADDRPREKLLLKGPASLSHAELIAILLGSGIRGTTAVDLAKQLLIDHHSRLDRLGQASLQELMEYKGIGEAKAITIVAALELGRRRQAEAPAVRSTITSSLEAYQFIYPHVQDLDHERFLVLFLNQAAQVLAFEAVSLGGRASTLVDVRVVFKKALDHRATSLIVAHNHPSGSLQPSHQDRTITGQLLEAGKVLAIPLRDHLIISNQGYYSFADEGQMTS